MNLESSWEGARQNMEPRKKMSSSNLQVIFDNGFVIFNYFLNDNPLTILEKWNMLFVN